LSTEFGCMGEMHQAEAMWRVGAALDGERTSSSRSSGLNSMSWPRTLIQVLQQGQLHRSVDCGTQISVP
jgi:hypothetical protein